MATNLPFSMKTTIYLRSVAAGGLGIVGAFTGPHADLAGIIAIWTEMLVTLAGQAGRDLSTSKATKIAAVVCSGVAAFLTGVKVASTVFTWTGVGTIPAVIANLGVNAVVTYSFGHAAGRIFLEKSASASDSDLASAILQLLRAMLKGEES